MYIIVGLGNPGSEYRRTRHNAGFDTVSALADRFNIEMDYIKHKAQCGKGLIEGNKVLLAMPQTYMNLSGESVRQIVDYYKIDITTDLIVVYDDIYLEPGQVRIRKNGSAGGHNGMKNIITHLGTDQFMRVRIGVGKKPKEYDLKDYVTGHFSPEDREKVETALINAGQGICEIMSAGIESAMNKYNRKEKGDNE